MTFRLSLSFVSSASLTTVFAVALAACSGEIAGTPNHGGSSSGSGSGSGSGGGYAPGTCTGACMRAYQLPCANSATQTEAQCEQSCASSLAQAQTMGCGSQFTAILGCFESGAVTCDAQGNANTTACDAQISALDRCMNPPPPGCSAIPYPGGGTTTCGGFGPGGGPDAGPGESTTSCSDGKGNTWTATCSVSSCSCAYNGTAYCSCAIGRNMSTCCPGT
jgi:hypothetical protein